MSEKTSISDLSDSYYMGIALDCARQAALRGEVPVGAILVLNSEIYSAAGNAREHSADPTAHAEVLAIRHASERLGTWRLHEATLYVTTEPCVLCTGALYLARVHRVVYGCRNPKGGALDFISAHEGELRLNHHIEIVGGIRELECAKLLKDFFQNKRGTVGPTPTPA